MLQNLISRAHDSIYIYVQDTQDPLINSCSLPATLFHFNFSMTMLHKFAQLRISFATKKHYEQKMEIQPSAMEAGALSVAN